MRASIAFVARRVGWFAKLPPYGVDEFYTLAHADMARLEALRPASQPD